MKTENELNHWSGERLGVLDAREYRQEVSFKPQGFWVDVGRDWKRWCKGERFRPEAFAFRHRIRVSSNANVLRLSGPDALVSFTKSFARIHPLLREYEESGMFMDHYIDWPDVAGKYQGIIIAPYCWSLRMEMMWYYPWDCASGCIWDTSAISIEAVYHKGRKLK